MMPETDGSRTTRLDQLLVARGLAPTRAKAQALILSGRVRCGATRLDKPGARVSRDAALEVSERPRHVSRGGTKLEAALRAWAAKQNPAPAIQADRISQ